MVMIKTRITRSGPIFQRPPGNPPGLNKGLQEVVQAVLEAGEQQLDTLLSPRPRGVFLSVSQAQKGKASRGHYRQNVMANSWRRNLHARIEDGGVVYGPWLEGVGRRNRTTRFKGYHSFRRTSQWLNKNFRSVAGPAIRRMIDRIS